MANMQMSPADHRPLDAAKDLRPGILILADDKAWHEAKRVADIAGLRLLDVIPLIGAGARLDIQVDCDAILLICQTFSPLLDSLIPQLEALAVHSGTPVLIVAGLGTIDLVYSLVNQAATQLLCDPQEAEVIDTLMSMTREDSRQTFVSDWTADRSGLEWLSAEVRRLSDMVEELNGQVHPETLYAYAKTPIADPGNRHAQPPLAGVSDAISERPLLSSQVTASQVRNLIQARRMRADFLPNTLFADPAWDMLLDLFAARLEHQQVSITSLCIASSAPPTTALRWIGTLTKAGLVDRHADPDDGRRIFISMNDDTLVKMKQWFRASRANME